MSVTADQTCERTAKGASHSGRKLSKNYREVRKTLRARFENLFPASFRTVKNSVLTPRTALAHRYQALALTLFVRTGPNRPLLLALVFSYRLRFYIAGLVPNQTPCKFLKTKIR
jgi:hypothetical protein